MAAAVRALGYDYYGFAREVTGTKRIAIICPFSSYYSFSERVSGIIRSLDPDQFSVLTFNVESLAQLHRYTEFVLRPGAVDGVVMLSLPLAEDTRETFRRRNIPLVTIERDFPGVPSVTIDNVEAGRKAARFLLSRQYRRPAFLGDSAIPKYAYPASRMRYDGFREGLEESGVPLPEDYVIWRPPDEDRIPDLVVQLLKLANPPDALFCCSDTKAMSVIRTVWNMELKVPQDLAVLGFDNLSIAENAGLSSVDQFLIESGRDAAVLLKKMIDGSDSNPADIVYDPRIRDRWST